MGPAKLTFLVAFAVFSIAVVFLAIFPPRTSRVFLNQRRAVESIRELNRAEYDFAARHPDVGFACKLRDLGEQGSEAGSSVGLVDRVLASGTKSWYHFEIRCPEGGSQRAASYTIMATPVVPGATGKYALCSNQSEEIWYSENGLAAECLASHTPIERKYR